MKILDLISFLLKKVYILFYREYALKLDEYHYDYKKEVYILTFRVRNKNAFIKGSILDFVKNNSIIDTLHPFDSYLVGTIKSMQDNKFVVSNLLLERDYEDYYIIAPCVDWIGTDFIENKLIFKAYESLTEVRISIEGFCKDFKLMRALSPTNTFLIGSIVTNSFIQGSI